MPYPKKFMSISELDKQGISREHLEVWVHMKDFPSFRVGDRGHWKVNTDLLDPWLIKKGYMKYPNKELQKIKDASN